MREIRMLIDDELANAAEEILEDMGLDFTNLMTMSLKKLIKEDGVSFLRSNQEAKEVIATDKNKMTKSKAVVLLKREGITFSKNTTFSSKNTGSERYWSNPSFEVLKQTWYLILNDWVKQELHLFVVPAGSISAHELVARNDLPDKIDLQIFYDDPTFTDSRSKVSFGRYLAKSLKY